MNDFTIKILLITIIISLIVKLSAPPTPEDREYAWIEGFSIIIMILIIQGITAGIDYQKDSQFLKHNKFSQLRNVATVYRNGYLISIHENSLMVGDILLLE